MADQDLNPEPLTDQAEPEYSATSQGSVQVESVFKDSGVFSFSGRDADVMVGARAVKEIRAQSQKKWDGCGSWGGVSPRVSDQ
jgi:hypothetical protein